MKKVLIALFIAAIILTPVLLFAEDVDEGDDYIGGDTVNKHDNSSLIDGDLVDKVERPTVVPTPEPTVAPTEKPAPTEAPYVEPTPKPKPRPTAVPTKKAVKRPVPTPVPTAVPLPAKRAAEFAVVQATAEEIAKKRTFENYFGLFDRDRKFRLIFTIQNTGEQPAFYTIATLASGHTSIIVSGGDKDLQTVLTNDKREITYEILILGSYDGDSKLPLTLKIKAAGFARDYPLDVYIEPANPYTLYYIAGGILILIIILLVIMSRRGGERHKKDYDFEIK